MKHPVWVLGSLNVSLCLSSFWIVFFLSQGWTFLFQQNVGGKHICNYLLNVRYIALCLVCKGFWLSFFIELFWLWEFEYCTSYGFTHKFWLLAQISISKGFMFEQISLTFMFTHLQVWCLHYFLSSLCSSKCLSHFQIYILTDVVEHVFFILKFGFLLMLLNVYFAL